MWVIGLLLGAAALVAPWGALVLALRHRGEIERLRQRVDELERMVPRGDALAAVPLPVEIPPPAPLAEPIPLPQAALAAPAPVAGRPSEGARVEQLIGGIWFQNVGSVLLLLGVFFLILWGYTTGRIGPAVLVFAGAGLGFVLAWRGDRIARSLPAFGHALIGVGLGIVYLSLYLGHFTLRVLPPWLAFGLLALVSLASVATGLSYRAQTLSTLGIVGAFIPQLIAVWIPLQGFSLPPEGLLGYFALIDVVVFALAARAGWSALDLAALALTASTWIAAFPAGSWGWGTEVALCALFVLLGLAPLPRLARTEGAVGPLDLAVLALAPLCLVASSWPFLAYASRTPGSILLIALAIVYLLAALWADARRPERALWRPLAGAAVLFLTVGLQRAVGHENTPMAWCIEGALLVRLGLGPRGGWLRLTGYVVSGLGALWLMPEIFGGGRWALDLVPVFNAGAVRDLVCLGALVMVAHGLRRGRELLSRDERVLPEFWTVLANFLLAGWGAREASHAAYAFEAGGGRWSHLPLVSGPALRQRMVALASVFACGAWIAQAMALLRLGSNPAGIALRSCGYVIAAIAAMVLFATLASIDPWGPGQLPVLYPFGLAGLWCMAALYAAAAQLGRRRGSLAGSERWVPEVSTVTANLVALVWTAKEAGHLAGIPGSAMDLAWAGNDGGARAARTLAAVFTSAAWTVQAGALLALGWARGSAFMRWLGLGLLGLTVLKFLLVDLQRVDVFWRFLTAIAVGAVLLGVSYFYQRRTRKR